MGITEADAEFTRHALEQMQERGISTAEVLRALQRGAKFTPPRTVTLDTKYDGAVGLSVWAGYAVLVYDKSGGRRVVEGPESFLLEYDETLAVLELSTGTPKTDATLAKTVYLRVQNNKVSDRIEVETSDLVKIELTVSYRVNFDGDHDEKWFAVENYVQLLCDHMRSVIRNVAKHTGIEQFYGNTIDIVRDAVLGASVDGVRAGYQFVENEMYIYDVEVLGVSFKDGQVAGLLLSEQTHALARARSQREVPQRSPCGTSPSPCRPLPESSAAFP